MDGGGQGAGRLGRGGARRAAADHGSRLLFARREGDADASGYLGHYYAWLGEEIAAMIVSGAAKSEEAVRGQIAAYEEAGCDELILFPSSRDPDQVDLLADAVGL